MNTLPTNNTYHELAERIIWFERPEQSLRDPVRFLVYAMTYATFEDMQRIREDVSDEQLRQALDNAPPGIFDPRSWAYWNVVLGRYPTPPMPTRKL